MSEGMAMAVRMRSTVMETPSSTMLKPRLRLRRVSQNFPLRPKVASSFGRMTGIPVDAGGPNSYSVQLRGRGRLLASAAKHSTFIQESAYSKALYSIIKGNDGKELFQIETTLGATRRTNLVTLW